MEKRFLLSPSFEEIASKFLILDESPHLSAIMENDDTVELEGTIHTVLPGTMFRVELPGGHLVLAHISGKMRKRFIRLVTGDRVKIEMSPYDTEKARIVYRMDSHSPRPFNTGKRQSPRSMARPGQPKKRAKPNPTPRRTSGGAGGAGNKSGGGPKSTGPRTGGPK